MGGVLDDYAYQKRTDKSSKKEKAAPKQQSRNTGPAGPSASDMAAARAREIQAQQEAARQRALEEAYRRQQEAAKKAKAVTMPAIPAPVM